MASVCDAHKGNFSASAASVLWKDAALTDLVQLLVGAAQGQAAAALLAAVAAGVVVPGSSCAQASASWGGGTAPWTGWAWRVGSGRLQQCGQHVSLPVGCSTAACRQGTARVAATAAPVFAIVCVGSCRCPA